MDNLNKYNKIFCELFLLPEGFNTETVKLNETDGWDSVGHMGLITALEDDFNIMLETEDILNLVSYQDGIEILKKYGIEI
ncbi:MAG: acyl carrier protein [Lachnospiraceae bacterium]|nr:acyl carrier protein [Lachnospiraceae bacterium]